MRWAESFVVFCLIWAVALGLFSLALAREQDAVFISLLVFCPSVGFLAGLGYKQLPALTWLGLISIPLAFAVFLLNWQVWNWDACPSGEEGEICQLEQVVVWLAGLYALGVAAAILVGVIVSRAFQRLRPRQIG